MTPTEKLIKIISSADESAELWLSDSTCNDVLSESAQTRLTGTGQFTSILVTQEGTVVELTFTTKYLLPLEEGVACIQILQAIILPLGGEVKKKKFPLHIERAGGANVI